MTMSVRDGGQSWRIFGWGCAVALLLAPAVAMRFTGEVRWDIADFLFGALLIGGTGGALDLAVRRSGSRAYRLGAAAALLATFGLIWVNVAVGIIGSEGNPANLLFAAVPASALIAASAMRFRAGGLALAMLVAASVQAAVGAAAAAGRLGAEGPIWPWDVIGATVLFTGLWLVSAALFRRAATISRR